jgi:hypothetical protein
VIKHIVFWKLNESLTGSEREETLRKIKAGFDAMRGQIPGLLRLEVGIDFLHSPESADFALYSEFESRAALDGYQAHPLHQALAPVIRDVRVERRVIDYEV